jgi:hypothetical protein
MKTGSAALGRDLGVQFLVAQRTGDTRILVWSGTKHGREKDQRGNQPGEKPEQQQRTKTQEQTVRVGERDQQLEIPCVMVSRTERKRIAWGVDRQTEISQR